MGRYLVSETAGYAAPHVVETDSPLGAAEWYAKNKGKAVDYKLIVEEIVDPAKFDVLCGITIKYEEIR